MVSSPRRPLFFPGSALGGGAVRRRKLAGSLPGVGRVRGAALVWYVRCGPGLVSRQAQNTSLCSTECVGGRAAAARPLRVVEETIPTTEQKGIWLADPESHLSDEVPDVALLIGADHYYI